MYYLVYGILYLLSLLPMPVLYLLSDFAYAVLYYGMGYRRKVVAYNLSVAFPEKAEGERKQIAKQFYRNFTDNFIETIKLLSADEAFIRKRCSGDFSVFEDLARKGVKCQIHLGHHFNWEYANLTLPLQVRQKPLTVYMPIDNKIFDLIFKKVRAKTGAGLLPATQLRTAILPYRNEPYILVLVADQNPSHPKNGYWIPFFSKPAPFLKAPESGARRGNIPVVFSHFTKVKRGHYCIHFQLAEEHPAETKPGEITKKYVAYLEQAIRQQPDLWLWSHRRWKYDWKPEFGAVLE